MFYAEHVWALLAEQEDANSLAIESDLASLSSMVIVLVESPGTIAEIGAFAMVPELRQKLLPILDHIHAGTQSFVNTGPLRWFKSDQEARFAPPIYADLMVDRREMERQVRERVGRLQTTGREKATPDLKSSHRHLLFLLCDIFAILGPAPLGLASLYLSRILGKPTAADLRLVFALAQALGLVSPSTSGINLFDRSNRGTHQNSLLHQTDSDLDEMRAQYAGVAMKHEYWPTDTPGPQQVS